MCLCVCVCLCERERERVCKYVYIDEAVHATMYDRCCCYI